MCVFVRDLDDGEIVIGVTLVDIRWEVGNCSFGVDGLPPFHAPTPAPTHQRMHTHTHMHPYTHTHPCTHAHAAMHTRPRMHPHIMAIVTL